MSINSTPSANRIHISFFGLRNAGKSSLVNAVTGQKLAIVSDTKGTTTDPVRKAMELLPLGPVVITDTPGFDDEGELGQLRVEKTRQVLRKTDIGVLVTDGGRELCESELEMIGLFSERKLPLVIARNKMDIADSADISLQLEHIPGARKIINVSALTGEGISQLKESLGEMGQNSESSRRLIGDLVNPGDTVVLVVPIDESAPKGRLILPQQQTIRDLLDHGCSALVCQPSELTGLLENLRNKPAIVVTDSQAFGEVSRLVPEDIYLTSFSILFARFKGELDKFQTGIAALDSLKAGDRVLISEGCTHHRQCNDIGTVKLPNLIRKYTGVQPEFAFSSGTDFPDDLTSYALVVHCGGCMLNSREVTYRVDHCMENGVPVLNYGIAIAAMNGILERSTRIFKG